MGGFDEDFSKVNETDFLDWNKLAGKSIFMTGATGVVGTSVINTLAYVNENRNLNLRITALVRNEAKAKEQFKNISRGFLRFVVGCVEELPKIEDDVDYIIHGASQTASKEFIEHAVETIETAVVGTRNILKLSKEKNVEAVVYLSSMEVYGYPERGHKVKEEEIGMFSPMDLRNSYPISKILCEAMCCAYAKEYEVPTKVIRLTQTFGTGVNYDDNRLFAYLGRCAKQKKDIVLKTTGETERCYIYIMDAVTAILAVMLRGSSGAIYNASNEETYCSIAEMAEKIASENGIKVVYDIQPPSINGFLQTLYMNLDTSALRHLGWKPIAGQHFGDLV